MLYTGFDLANIQQLLNSLQCGLDNWVYACAGSDGGTITCAEKTDCPPSTLRGRGIRFDPDVPGSLEPTSGGGQYGLAADDFGRWFTATNSQHLRHIVLPDHYLRRNPSLPVSAVTLDIPEHGAACKVFRISPFEAWRVERTTRRAGGPDAKRFPTTELVPGGYITSACSPLVYTADLFPAEYRGSVFVCDPANNLIIRDTLHAERGDLRRQARRRRLRVPRLDRQLVPPGASDDRPGRGAVRARLLPRGDRDAAVAAGRHQEAVNLESRGRGRIWRITTAQEGTKPPTVDLAQGEGGGAGQAPGEREPVVAADGAAAAVRAAGQGRDRAAARNCCRRESAVGRLHALWTLEGLGALKAGAGRGGAEGRRGGRPRAGAAAGGERTWPSRSRCERRSSPWPTTPRRASASRRRSRWARCARAEAAQALAKIARHADTDSWTRDGDPQLGVEVGAGAAAGDGEGEGRSTAVPDAAGGAGRGDGRTTPTWARRWRCWARRARSRRRFRSRCSTAWARGWRRAAGRWRRCGRSRRLALEASVKKAKALFEQAATLATRREARRRARAAAVRLLGRGPFAPLKDVAAGAAVAAVAAGGAARRGAGAVGARRGRRSPSCCSTPGRRRRRRCAAR